MDVRHKKYLRIFIASVFMVIAGTVSPSQADNLNSAITLRAPFDGYVVSLPSIGSQFGAGSSISVWAGPTLVDKCEEAEVRLTGAIMLLMGFPDPVLPEFENGNGTLPVVKLYSPLLEKQIADAEMEVAAHKKSLERVNDAIQMQPVLDNMQLNLERRKDGYEYIYVRTKRNATHDTADKVDGMSKEEGDDLINKFNELSREELAYIQSSQKRFRDFNLSNMKSDAERNLNSAICTRMILDATSALGKIYCPFKCKVVQLHAARTQWVTKGDPLISVAPD